MKLIRHAASLWRIKHDPEKYARSLGVSIGKRPRFLGITFRTFGSEPYLIRLGDHVTITSGVQFVTHDGGVWIFRDQFPDIDVFGPILIGNNVFIGINTVILPNVTIGDDCVIGAGSIVTKDISSGSVAAGVPARVLGTVSEYQARCQEKSLHIRSVPAEVKKEFLLKRFGSTLNRPIEH